MPAARDHSSAHPGPRAARLDDRRGGLVPRLRRRLLLRSAALVRASRPDSSGPSHGCWSALERGGHRATVFVLGWIARAPSRPRARGGAPRARDRPPRRHAPPGGRALAGGVSARICLAGRDRLEKACGVRADAVPGRRVVHSLAGGCGSWDARRRKGFVADASMTADAAPRPRRGTSLGPHRIELDNGSLVELPPLTGRGFGRRDSGRRKLGLPDSCSRARLAASRRTLPPTRASGRLHVPSLGVRHGASADGGARAARLARSLRRPRAGSPSASRRWLAQERCVAVGRCPPRASGRVMTGAAAPAFLFPGQLAETVGIGRDFLRFRPGGEGARRADVRPVRPGPRADPSDGPRRRRSTRTSRRRRACTWSRRWRPAPSQRGASSPPPPPATASATTRRWSRPAPSPTTMRSTS